MTATLPAIPAATPVPDALAAMSTERLREELARSLSETADQLMRLAMIVRALDERGEDLSDLRMGLLAYLRQIAHGQVAPEVVVRFAASPSLLRAVVESRGNVRVAAPSKVKVGQVTADRKRAGVWIGRAFAPAGDVVEALAMLADPEDDPDAKRTEQVASLFTPKERERLGVAAARAGTSVSTLLYRAAIAHGLLAPQPGEE